MFLWKKFASFHTKVGLPHSSVGYNMLAMQDTPVPFLGWEDPLEKGMAIHSSTLAWKIPWIEDPGRLQSMGSQVLDTVTKPPPPPPHKGHEILIDSRIRILQEVVNFKGESMPQ